MLDHIFLSKNDYHSNTEVFNFIYTDKIVNCIVTN